MGPTDVLRDRLTALLARAVDADVAVARVTALSGGAASLTFAVDATRDGAPWPLIFQRGASGEAAVGAMPKALQAQLQVRARAAGLPVAEVVAIAAPDDGVGDGFVMARIDGESLAPKWLRLPDYAAARAAMVDQCATALARLHAIPMGEFADLPLSSASPADARAAMFDLYRGFGVDVPVFDLAFAWLRERLPADAPSVLVHGDFRSGNFIVGPEGLRAVLDWELAHLGHPMADIGWLCTNTWRFGEWRLPVGGFGERAAFFDAYAAAGGRADRTLAPVFELWGSLRWGVMCLQMAAAHLSGARRSVELAAIGRRVSETEADILHILKHGGI
jgi:aminoglycoside phosphotransferase (APT) family kinase protein